MRRWRWLWILILLLVAVLLWLSQRTTDEREERSGPSFGPRATQVRVVTAALRDLDLTVDGLGTASPSETVVVRSRVTGPITAIYFEEGQWVEAGAPLFEIDPRPFEARLAQVRAEYAQNEARLANAETDLQRYQTLYRQQSIARQQVDTQQALVAERRAMRATLSAQIEQASLDVEYSLITAPISGRLGLRQVDIGNLVTANSSEGLVTITQQQPMDVSFALSERYVSTVAARFYGQQPPPTQDSATAQGASQGADHTKTQVTQKGVTAREGDEGRAPIKPIKVLLYDRTGQHHIATGQLISMDNQIDVGTGTVQLKARFDNEQHTLFPNQFVNVVLYVAHVPQALAVPTDALQHGREGSFVFLVQTSEDSPTVQVRYVSTGIAHQGYTQIIEGLAPGDQVVIEGIDRLRDGARIDIIDTMDTIETSDRID